MLRKLLSRTATCVAALAVAGAGAGEVFVGGPQGVVFRGDSSAGGFQFFGTCGGPINSMAIVGTHLFLGDTSGLIYRLGLDSGLVEAGFQVSNNAAAMAVHEGSLLIGGSDRTVLVVNPASGAVLDTYNTVDPVATMIVHDGYIYVSGPTSAVYRAPANSGVFDYFTCFCFGSVNGLAANDTHLFLVDSFQALWRVRLSDGAPDSVFFLSEPGEALGFEGGMVVAGDAIGDVTSRDPQTGDVTDSVSAPIEVFALVFNNAVPCPTDFSGDGLTDLTDLSMLLASFGVDAGGDLDDDGMTGLSDLSIMLTAFGTDCGG